MNIFKNFLSRFSPKYPETLVYMLQASEYITSDYLAWLHRTRDFSAVSVRKKLVFTPKAMVLLTLVWASTVSFLWALIFYVLFGQGPAGYKFITVLLVIGVFVYILPYVALAFAHLFYYLIQYAVERKMIADAKAGFKNTRAIKIAIAGSYGKTTIKEILKTVLSEGKKTAATHGNQNTPIGISRFARNLTGDEEVIIVECGEYYPGDIKQLSELVNPDIGIITGINEAHLGRFKTIQTTVKTIFELADHLKDRPLYINAESEYARTAAADRHIQYTRRGVQGRWNVTNAGTSLTGTSFTAEKDGEQLNARSKLLGLHQIGPLVASIDIAKRLGLTNEQIMRGIDRTEPFEHRLKPIRDVDGAVMIDDSYNGNPDGIKAAIEFLKTIPAKRKIYITPGLVEMGKRTKDVHIEIGRHVASAADVVMLIRNSVTPYIEQGLQEAGFSGRIMWQPDSLSLLGNLRTFTAAGDVILMQNDWPDNYA